MKTVKLSDSTVIENIRESMPVATTNINGLMPRITGMFQKPYIELNAGLDIEFNYGYGLVSLQSSQKGYSGLFLIGAGSVKVILETDFVNFKISTIKDTPNRINIYKKTEYELIVQNKTNDQFRFYIGVI